MGTPRFGTSSLVLGTLVLSATLSGCRSKDSWSDEAGNARATRFLTSYMITNRSLGSNHQPETESKKIKAVPSDGLYFFTAPGGYNHDPSQFTLDVSSGSDPLTTLPKGFFEKLLFDLLQTRAPVVVDGPIGPLPSPMQLTLYIHGLANDWASAVTSSMDFGESLLNGAATWARKPPPVPSDSYRYDGLVIGFTWPSADAIYSDLHYGAYDRETGRTEATPNTRGNILDSLESFGTLMKILGDLKSALVPLGGLVVNVVCHSEGNFMMMEGMEFIARNGGTSTPDAVLLLAADINRGGLQQTQSGSKTDLTTGISEGSGSAAAIANQSKVVYVFYSNHDETLGASDILYRRFHNRDYSRRLGRYGPSSFSSDLLPRVFGIDCSAVVEGGTSDLHFLSPLFKDYEAGWIPKHETRGGDFDINPHGSYRYVPQILWVMSQVLQFEVSELYNVHQGSHPASFLMAWDDPRSR